MFAERYLTKDTLHHILLSLPAIILFILFGTSLNSQWWFYEILYSVGIISLILNIFGLVIAPINKLSALYAIIRMFCFLLFIPMFCCLILAIFFGIMLIFGIDFNPTR